MKEDLVKRTVSHFVSAFPLALVMLALVVSPAFAHHPTGSATASCDGYDISGNYVGGSSYRWLDWNVTVTIDGVPEVIAGSWDGIDPGFEIFSRTGSGPHDVEVSGYIKMYNDNAVSEDTYTKTEDRDFDNTKVNINFFDSDRQVTITAKPGYDITFVGIDYDGSNANEVTFGPQASPFTYDAPGNETIDNVTVTVHRPASHSKGSLADTFDDWKPGTGKTFVFDDVNCVPDYQLNLSHIECVDEQVEVHFVLLNVPDGITPGTLTYTYGTIEPGAHTGNVWHYTTYLPDGFYDIESASVVVDGDTVQLHNPHEYAGEYDCAPEEASISVEVGQCRWEEIHGPPWGQSVTRVEFTGVGATITIPDVYVDAPLPFQAALTPGTYTWYATPLPGYVIPAGQETGTIVAGDCTPPSATVEVAVGACSWNEETGSLTAVSFTIDHANVTVEGPGGPYELTGSATLNLGPGSYSYSWVAQEGYIGSGEGSFEIGECYETCGETIPGDVVYGPIVDVGDPVWGPWVDNGDGTFTRTGTQTTTQHWTQNIVDARDGQTVCNTIEGDIPGEREVEQTIEGSSYLYALADCAFAYLHEVKLDPDGAFISDEVIETYAWTNVYETESTDFNGRVDEIFEPEECRQDRPTSVELDQGVCRWDGEVSTTEVTFTLGEGVTVLLSGPNGSQSFTESTTLILPPGSYSWSAVADEGYVIEGPAEGQFAVGSCEPGVASVSVTFGVCKFEKGASIAEVTFTLSGDVTVTLTGPNGFEMVLTETTTLELLDGHYEWTAEASEGSEMEGEDSGAFDLNRCEPREQPRCPTCGAPIKETAGESMGIAWFSDEPCDPSNARCWFDFRDTVGGWVKLWTQIESFVTRKGTTTPLTEVVAANGETWYESFFRDPHSEGDFILWGPGGYGDRFRDHVPDSERALHKYSACSIFPSWADTRLVDGQGYALWLPGHNTSDWAQFLLDNGFFPDEEFRGTAALKWAADLRENGKEALFNWDGDLDSLPLFPLPPR